MTLLLLINKNSVILYKDYIVRAAKNSLAMWPFERKTDVHHCYELTRKLDTAC
jgi:hypothetical protein